MKLPASASNRRTRESSIALFTALLATALLVTVATAHGVALLKSEPLPGAALDEPPAQVRAWFSEELIVGGSTLHVFDSKGKQIDNGDGGVDLNDADHTSMIVSLPPLPDDVYTVRWFTVLEDGDASEGLFRFTVGNPTITSSQVVLPEPLSDPEEGGLPTIWIAGIMILIVALVATIGWVLRLRLIRTR